MIVSSNKQYLFIILLFLACTQANDSINGAYILQNANGTRLAEILELNQDSSFVLSGLENDDYLLTWVVEGEWRLQGDTIWLNSIGYDEKDYGKNMNIKFLESYADSVRYLDQGIVIFREVSLTINNNNLLLKSKGEELKYTKVE